MFEQGIAELQKANYAAAEINFKTRDPAGRRQHVGARRISRRRFAAAGRDGEAAGAWQTALIDGSDVPQIYEWLGRDAGAGARLHGARDRFSRKRWDGGRRIPGSVGRSRCRMPRSARAATRFACSTATSPTAAASPTCCSWWSNGSSRCTAAGAVVINRTADLAMARNYAAEYAKANGPKQALVQQWLDFLANEKP